MYVRLLAVLLVTCLTRFVVATDQSTAVPASHSQGSMLILVGAAGEEKFGVEFSRQATELQQLALEQSLKVNVIGLPRADSEVESKVESDRDRLKIGIEQEMNQSGPLWIIMIGHGTFDGKKAKFNLRGPDVSATEMKEWLNNSERPVAIVNCASASAPFINELSATNRVIISATKSGHEMNATRFGGFFTSALSNQAADLDKDHQVSLLEAFLFASGQVAEFYESAGRLATEHALIDDNSDGRGTPPDWFRGVRVNKQSQDKTRLPDGTLAHQWHLVPSEFESSLSAEFREKRNAIELQVEQLRLRKTELGDDEFYAKLDLLMVELARLYDQLP